MQPLLLVLLFGGALILWWGLLTIRYPLLGAGAALLGTAFFLMMALDAVDPVFIPALIVMGALGGSLKVVSHRGWQTVGWTVYGLVILALGFRLFPQLSPLPVFEALETTTIHTFQFPPEKLLLMVLVPIMVLKPWQPVSETVPAAGESAKRFLLILAATLVVVIPLALGLGHVELSLTTASRPYLVYWLSYNLVFVCILEESFFRGILQNGCIRGLHRLNVSYAGPLGVLAAAVLFGIAHSGGGLAFVLLATVAGIGYGAVYYLTGRLHYAVWLHFIVNAVQKLGFASTVG